MGKTPAANGVNSSGMFKRTGPSLSQPLERDSCQVSPAAQDLAEQGLVVRKELGLEAEPAGQLAKHVVVGPALAAGRNRRRVVHHVVMAVRAVDVDLLELRGRRQHEIGVIDGIGGIELVHDDEQIVASEPLDDFLLVRGHGRGVAVVHVEGPDGGPGSSPAKCLAELVHIDQTACRAAKGRGG